MADQKNIPDLWHILENADEAEIRTFLWKQAQRSSVLNVKLRAYLVEGMEDEPGVNKYSQVLNLLVHHNVQGVVKLTKRSIQLLRDIAQHFVDLQEKNLQSGELRESWKAGHAVITALHLLMDKYHGPDAKLVAILSESYAHTQVLLLNRPAPELKQVVIKSFLELVKRSHHTIYDLRYNAVTSLMLATSPDADDEEIKDLIIEKLSGADPANSQYRYWAALFSKIPETQPDFHKFIRSDHVFEIAYLLYSSGDMTALMRLLKTFDSLHQLSPAQLSQWTKWKFEAALKNGTHDEIHRAGLALLKLNQDMSTYHHIKEASSLNALNLDFVSDELSERLRAQIYAAEGRWNELVKLMNTTQDLSLLIEHCDVILDQVDEPYTLIKESTNNFVENNGGPQVHENIVALINALRHKHREDLAAKLLLHLHSEFPGRFDDITIGKSRKRQKKASTDEDAIFSVLPEEG